MERMLILFFVFLKKKKITEPWCTEHCQLPLTRT